MRRRADPRDRRRSLLGLTDKGRRFDVATGGTIESAVASALDNTSPETLQAAREVLHALADSLALSELDANGAFTVGVVPVGPLSAFTADVNDAAES